MLADTFGRPVRFRITPGQASDITVAPDLLEGLQTSAVLADKAYDGNTLRASIAAMNAVAVIPSKRNRRIFIPHESASISIATRSSAASDASNTLDASRPAMIVASLTSPASYTSPLR